MTAGLHRRLVQRRPLFRREGADQPAAAFPEDAGGDGEADLADAGQVADPAGDQGVQRVEVAGGQAEEQLVPAGRALDAEHRGPAAQLAGQRGQRVGAADQVDVADRRRRGRRVRGQPGEPRGLQAVPAAGRGRRVRADGRGDARPGRPRVALQRLHQREVRTGHRAARRVRPVARGYGHGAFWRDHHRVPRGCRAYRGPPVLTAAAAAAPRPRPPPAPGPRRHERQQGQPAGAAAGTARSRPP